MKKIILAISALSILSCAKKESYPIETVSAENKKIESMNVERKKLNDSIAIRNQRNIFKNLSGKHQLKYSTEESIEFSGTVNFQKTGRDLYLIRGTAKSGKNSLKIKGTIKRVSEKHLNFEGEITQNINGNIFKRNKNTTFLDEGKGNFWRLQNKVNGLGFVDYIDIYF